jgi:hypothetical protein
MVVDMGIDYHEHGELFISFEKSASSLSLKGFA